MLISGCDRIEILDKLVPIKNMSWNIQDTLVYDFEIKNTDLKYDMYLMVRHRDIYEFQNLYIKTLTKNPDLSISAQTISCNLCDDMGSWNGQCIGDVCFVSFKLNNRIKFLQKGIYQIKLVQEMRLTSVKGIMDIGLKITQSPEISSNEQN